MHNGEVPVWSRFVRAGVFYTGWHQHENLVRAMLNGRKLAPEPGDSDV